MSNIINFSDYVNNCASSNSDSERSDSQSLTTENVDLYSSIIPLIRDVCVAAGVTGLLADEVIAEYKLYFEQLAALDTGKGSGEQFNHACHIILGLLIKGKLPH